MLTEGICLYLLQRQSQENSDCSYQAVSAAVLFAAVLIWFYLKLCFTFAIYVHCTIITMSDVCLPCAVMWGQANCLRGWLLISTDYNIVGKFLWLFASQCCPFFIASPIIHFEQYSFLSPSPVNFTYFSSFLKLLTALQSVINIQIWDHIAINFHVTNIWSPSYRF